jgi:hypothetical protein
MLEWTITGLMLVVAFIHLIPTTGFLGEVVALLGAIVLYVIRDDA